MRCGRVSCRSWVLAIFLMLACSFSDDVYCGRSLNVSSYCRQIWKTQVLLSTAERRVFTYGLQVTSWFYANVSVSTNNSADYAFFVCFVRPVRPRFLQLRKVRRQSRPCIYYANTVSTFQPLLEGDLLNKSLLVNDIARFFARKIMRIVIPDMDTVPDDLIVSDAKIYCRSSSPSLKLTFWHLFRSHQRKRVI